MSKAPTLKEINERFDKGVAFKQRIGLYETVQVNEDFFIGKQWEGVQHNGLPTPTFNFLKQVVLFQVATITGDNLAMQATAMPSILPVDPRRVDRICQVMNHQYAAIIERCQIVSKLRQFMRNAAVDGDGCMYFWFDTSIDNGQLVKGEIQAEVLENTRVHFGNPNCRNVQDQPYIILSRRSLVEDARALAESYKEMGVCGIDDPDQIQADSEKFANKYDGYTDDKVTVLTYLYRDRETKTIWCCETTENGILRKAYDTGYRLYPLVWLSWDYIQDCYHGQAMITGLIPNQKFYNKMFAMVGISLMTTAFPKIVYDRNRIRMWDGSVGTAVGVNGNVDNVAKTISGAALSPQVPQFLDLVAEKTRSFLGASNVALGDSRPDNATAILSLQKAANTPMELTKQNKCSCVEEMGLIWQDMMSVRYGVRQVQVDMAMDDPGQQPLGMALAPQSFLEPFDFSVVRDVQIAVKQDVGTSSYWSEMANMQTLDNLLMQGHITLGQYLERLPSGYISKKQELIREVKAAQGMPPVMPGMGTGMTKETTDMMNAVG